MRIILTPLLLLLAGASLRAQWTFLGPHALSNYTDIAINHGVIVAAASAKSPPRITYASNDGGATWDSVFSRGGTRAVAALDTGFILQIEGGNSFRGDATGHVWTQIADPGRNVTRYFYDRSNRRLYAVTQRGALILSEDQGSTWRSLGVPSQDLTFVHARGNTIVTGYNGTFGGAFLSVDGGATWSSPDALKSAGTPAGGFVGTDGRLYFDFTAGIFPSVSSLWRSGDGGTSWSELTKGTNNIGGTSILMQAQVYAEGSTILFTAGKDIWTSDDDGGSWRTRNEGITPSGTSAITAMAFAGGDLYLLLQAFTPPSATSGVYRRPAAEIGLSGQASSVEVGEHAVAKARLTIAPNPMRDHATITLHLDAPVTARVAVYDMLGDEVALLHDGALEPGEHRMSWEGDGIAAGLYVVRATIDGKVIAGKLTRSR